MTATHSAGPSVVFGQIGGSSTRNSNPEAGPSVTYQGDAILDVRYPYQPGVTGLGKVYAYLDTPYILQVDNIPATLSTTVICAAQATTAATSMTLINANTAGTGVSINCPVVAAGTGFRAANLLSRSSAGVSATGLVGLDVGMTYANFNGGTKVLSSFTTSGNTAQTAGILLQQFYIGQKLWIAGAGGSGQGLFTYVTAVGTSSVTVADAGTTVTRVAVATLDNSQSALWPYVTAGAAALFDPTQGLCRAVSVTGGASAVANNITIRGYDIYGNAMSEVIAFAGGGAATVNGKKAFKYIASATPDTTDSGGGHTIAVGTTDIYGINLRSDKWEYTNFYVAGAFITSSTGWVLSDTTSPATTTTGDVRGTYALQAAANGTTNRVAMFTSVPLVNLVSATPDNTVPLFGVTQV